MFLMQNSDQFQPIDLEHLTGAYGRGAGGPALARSSHALFTEKVPGRKQCHRGFFAACGNDAELGAARLEIEYRVGPVSLSGKDLPRLDVDHGSSRSRVREVLINNEQTILLF